MITRRKALIGMVGALGAAGAALSFKEAPIMTLKRDLDILNACVGRHGLWAAPARYDHQCWTRDFALALLPVAHHLRGGRRAAENHLLTLARLQRADGSIPILFLDGLWGHAAFLWSKGLKSLKSGKPSFLLKRYLAGELDRATPGTRDSELLFIYASQHPAMAHLQDRVAPAVAAAFAYIEKNLLGPDGLLLSCDWRDTMDQQLGRQPLLTNNALWFKVLKTAGRYEQAAKVAAAIQARTGGLLADYPGAPRPDPFGIALGVLTGLIPPFWYTAALLAMGSCDSPCGVTIQCKHNVYGAEEAEVIERTQGVVVWPFVVGYVVKACRMMAAAGLPEARTFGLAQQEKLRLIGHAEWYDPSTGKGYGSPVQGWTAALRLDVLGS